MPRLLLLALGVLSLPGCLSTGGDELGRVGQEIIGGTAASPTDYPSVVALEEAAPGSWFCTGTLITSQWVLTAAHCVDGAPAAGMRIRFDDADANDAAGGKVVAVSEIHSHPGFNWEAWDNDIALVKLAEPVTDRTPTPIHRELVPPMTAVADVGYGVADNMDGGGGVLREVAKVTADCAGANDPTVSGDHLICMDASDGRGSCFGDSGGPTFALIDGQRVVVGVTSGGTGDVCGAGWDLYSSVFAELAFVDSIMNAPPPQPEPDPVMPPIETDMSDEDVGCSTGGGSGGGLVIAALGMLLRRRRRS